MRRDQGLRLRGIDVPSVVSYARPTSRNACTRSDPARHRHGARDYKLARIGLRDRHRQQALSTGDRGLTHEYAACVGVRPKSQRQRTTRNPHVVLLVPQMHIRTANHQNALLSRAFSFNGVTGAARHAAFISARASRRCGSSALLRAVCEAPQAGGGYAGTTRLPRARDSRQTASLREPSKSCPATRQVSCRAYVAATRRA